tara:strand:+ start:42 stop:2591 length:2550 start_codon:yes stop_codon:yes gene_type:complete
MTSLDNGIKKLKEEEDEQTIINNPFLSKLDNNIIINSETYNLYDVNKNKLKKVYRRIYILYSLENININEYDQIELNNFKLLCRKLKLLKGHFHMLDNDYHKYNLIVLNKKYLNYIDSNINFNEDELVIKLFGIKEDIIKLYLQQYNSDINLTNYLKIKEMNKFINHNNKFISFNLINYLNQITESNYWSIYNNCKLNITIPFIKREFNIKLYNIKSSNIRNVLTDVLNNDCDYLSFMNNDSLNNDISNNILKNGICKYEINDNIFNNKDLITDLIYNIKNVRELYYLVMNLVSSKDYCHLILNNYEVMKLLNDKDFFSKFFELNLGGKTFIDNFYLPFKYVLFYAWITFYTEENIKKSNIKENDRFVFDIKTANKLPHYPYISTDPRTSPYFTMLVDKIILSPEKNVNTFGYSYNNSNPKLEKYYGITTLELFEKRLNIFCNKNINSINIFKNINWDNIAISGSVISASLPNINPLMFYFSDNIKDIINNKTIFEQYIEEFYKNSDIDIMCNCESSIDFIFKIHEFHSQLSKNINIIANEEINTELEMLKRCNIIINDTFIKEKLNDDYTSDESKNIIYNNYKKYYIDQIEHTYRDNKIFKNKIFNNYFEPCLLENINIIVNNDAKNEIKYYDSFKYKIKSNKILRRNIEIFKIKYPSFFSCVSNFHLPCVRAYYTKNNVYMLPSCITSIMTFVNIDYKYFSGSTDPYEIINKYRSRGFGTYLNNSEKSKLVNYSYKIPKWKQRYKLYINNRHSIDRVFKIKDIIKYNFYTGKIKNLSNNRLINNRLLVDTIEVLRYLYQSNHPINCNIGIDFIQFFKNNLIQINNNGNIKPYKKYIIDILFDSCNTI